MEEAQIARTDDGEPQGSLTSYVVIHSTCAQVLEQSLATEAGFMHAKSHAFISDLERWLQVLELRPETDLLRLAIREYQFGLVVLSQGFYRHAYASLRLFFELAVAAVYFSAHLVELREWQRDIYDINWSTLSNSDNGVFSVRFSRAFCADLQGEILTYLTMSKKLYRECSLFVHGNPAAMASISGSIEFN